MRTDPRVAGLQNGDCELSILHDGVRGSLRSGNKDAGGRGREARTGQSSCAALAIVARDFDPNVLYGTQAARHQHIDLARAHVKQRGGPAVHRNAGAA